MLLSVVVYNHKLMPGQWAGTAVVFAGISVEAWVKRRGPYITLCTCVLPSLLMNPQMSTPNELYKRRRKRK